MNTRSVYLRLSTSAAPTSSPGSAAAEASVVFDGHRGDPHFYPLLRTIPGVIGEPLELLEIPSGTPV